MDEDDRDGSYEYKGYGPARYFFRLGERLVQADKWIVTYAELRRVRCAVLYWRARTKSLLVPAAAPLPLLYGRTVVLQSGLLPGFHTIPPLGLDSGSWTSWLEYHNVSLTLADTICKRLGQATQRYEE